MNILITGATSAIAQSTVKEIILKITEPHNFILTGRNKKHLEMISSDLLIRGANTVDIICMDHTDLDNLEELVNKSWRIHGKIDLAILAQGTLPNQVNIENTWKEVHAELKINSLSFIAISTTLSKYMQDIKSGTIVLIGSVAGDRGRQSNYVYGTAKGSVSIFAQGLRNRLYKYGVNVITVKPGLTDTPMTNGMNKDGLLWSSPDKVAQDIVRAIRKNKSIVYSPSYWRFIMFVIRNIPEIIFKKLSL